jgi:hypothetical protein
MFHQIGGSCHPDQNDSRITHIFTEFYEYFGADSRMQKPANLMFAGFW